MHFRILNHLTAIEFISFYQYAISLNNTGGKEMLATLQAAKLTDTEVQVVGSTQCAAFDNKQSPADGEIK